MTLLTFSVTFLIPCLGMVETHSYYNTSHSDPVNMSHFHTSVLSQCWFYLQFLEELNILGHFIPLGVVQAVSKALNLPDSNNDF